MKKYICKLIIVMIPVLACVLAPVFATLDYPFGESDTILTNQESDVVGDAVKNSLDPLRDGTKLIGKPIGDKDNGDNIYFDDAITTTGDAWTRWTRYIKWVMNWALWVIGLVALIYLIYHGILAVTAWANDDQYKKWTSGMKFALFAIGGIAIAWFIISAVFRLINLLTGS